MCLYKSNDGGIGADDDFVGKFIYISFRKERLFSLVYFSHLEKGSFFNIDQKKEEKKNRIQGAQLMNCLTGNCSGT